MNKSSGHRHSVLALAATLVVGGCNFSNPVDDAKKTAALRNVTMSFDSMSVDFGFPQGAVGSDKSFGQLLAGDSAKYANPANYTITFGLTMTADNTANGAEDAKFDGMDVDVVMDTIKSSPIETTAGGFEVARDTAKTVQTQGAINLATHRKPGLYVFQQVVDGADLATVMAPSLNYKIGSLQGAIDLPEISRDIPTRVDAETKALLQGVLDSGVFME